MTLTDRIGNLLQRQIVWFEDALAWYAKLDKALGTEAYEELLNQLSQHGTAITAFTREREILEKELRESGATQLPGSLKPLADRATALAEELGTAQQTAAARTTDAAQHVQEELGTLQRGRNVMDGYRAGEAEGVQWLDRKG
jgi:hypothetical protein